MAHIEVSATVDSGDGENDQFMTICCTDFPGDVVEVTLGDGVGRFSASDLIACLRAVSGHDDL